MKVLMYKQAPSRRNINCSISACALQKHIIYCVYQFVREYLRDYGSQLATQHAISPANLPPYLPLAPSGVYSIIRFPLFSTYSTCSTFKGPPFSIMYGFRTSRRCLMALHEFVCLKMYVLVHVNVGVVHGIKVVMQSLSDIENCNSAYNLLQPQAISVYSQLIQHCSSYNICIQ